MPTKKSEEEHLEAIALPSLIGRAKGKEIFGEEYVIYPWIAYMEQRIIEAIMDETHERYLVINAPPQTGKSSYVGVLLPFWVTGMFPNKNLMYISYSDDFSKDKSKDVRNLHRAYGKELFNSSVDPEFDTAAEWRMAGGRGGMLAAGVGGLITGKPGHVIIIDDLIKNAEEARSKATKAAHVAEWDGTISRRIQPGTTVIIIATRWAEDDLTGELKRRVAEDDYSGPPWEFIEFPAFAEPDPEIELSEAEQSEFVDIIGREFGEVLDCRFSRIPDRAPEDFFTLARSGMDPMVWSSLYQQHPSMREGGMFVKESWVYEHPDTWPVMEEMVRVWDLAATEGGGDWTVGTKTGRGRDGRFYVMDVRRVRYGSGKVLDLVTQTAAMDGFTCAIQIEEEKGGSGKTNTEFFHRLLPMHNVSPAKAEGDKVSRGMPGAAMQNRKRVVLPSKDSNPSWSVRDFTEELGKVMPDGRLPKHDDQFDTYSYGMIKLVGKHSTELWIPGQEAPMLPGSDVLLDDQESDGQLLEGFDRFVTMSPVIIGGQAFYG